MQVVKQIQTDIVNGELRTPTKIPKKVQDDRKKTKLRRRMAVLESLAAFRAAFRADRWAA